MRKSTANGRKFENIIKDYLDELGVDYEEQPLIWPDHVSGTVIPDFKINLPNETLWVFAQQDFFNGGLQSGRFDHIVLMDRFAWPNRDVFYVTRHPGIVKPTSQRMTEHRKRKETLYADLVERQVTGTLDQLMVRINGLMSKD